MARWWLTLIAAALAASPAGASAMGASAASSGRSWQAAAFSAAVPLAGRPMSPALGRVVQALDLSRPDHPNNPVILAPLAASLKTARPGAAWNEEAFAGLADEQRLTVLSEAAREAAELADMRARHILLDIRQGRIPGPALRRIYDDAEALWLGSRLYMEPGLWKELGEALPALQRSAERFQAERRRRLEAEAEETARRLEERMEEGATPVKDDASPVRWDDPSGYDGFLAEGDGKLSGYDFMQDRQEEHKRRNPNEKRGLKPSGSDASGFTYHGRDTLPPSDPDPRAQEDWRRKQAFLSDRSLEAAANARYPLSGVEAWYGELLEKKARDGRENPGPFWTFVAISYDMLEQKLRSDIFPLLRASGRLGPWGRALLPALRRQVDELYVRMDKLRKNYDIPGAGGQRGVDGGRRGIWRGRLELLNLIDREADRLKRKDEKAMDKAAALSAAVARRAEDAPFKEIAALVSHFEKRVEAARKDGDPAHPQEVLDQIRAGSDDVEKLKTVQGHLERALRSDRAYELYQASILYPVYARVATALGLAFALLALFVPALAVQFGLVIGLAAGIPLLLWILTFYKRRAYSEIILDLRDRLSRLARGE